MFLSVKVRPSHPADCGRTFQACGQWTAYALQKYANNGRRRTTIGAKRLKRPSLLGKGLPVKVEGWG